MLVSLIIIVIMENLTLNIQINNCTIDYVNHFKLLGVTIDSNITWNIQTTNVCKKISSRIGLIRRLKNVLPNHTIHNLYYPLIQSNIENCLTVWGLSAQKYIGQLQKLQNRAARVITGNFNRSSPSHLII